MLHSINNITILLSESILLKLEAGAGSARQSSSSAGAEAWHTWPGAVRVWPLQCFRWAEIIVININGDREFVMLRD